MAKCKIVFLLFGLAAFSVASPAKPSFWKGTPLDTAVESMRSDCANNDEIACMKYKVMSLLDTVFKKDSYQLTEDISVVRNAAPVNEVSGRSDGDFLDTIESYIRSHDVSFKLPIVGGEVTVQPRNLDQDEFNVNVKLNDSADEAKGAARRSKLKKIIVPILVFVLLKALTVVPLALGVLGLKAWNALQLSFFSFVVSVALAIFQLCKKIAADNAHPPTIAAHGWDAAAQQYYQARAFESQPAMEIPVSNVDAQSMAYAAYN
ncbi:uncharacterized protein LOC123291126 [Chrysoperla carnea]|uniref:uncharacterized protein LOC123291126 n=1 Tax=Chrysoperla carnea TaxID=189513 RepID=UPI001D093C2B|nr:uncharacterized protein LOC123291126 [Chrysoperla carnea]